MNETVKRIVEILFQDTEMTEEVQAMRDELMDNCQQRYEDLVAQGRSEDEAIALVVESLKGMEEVIGAYPRSRSAASHAQETDEDGRELYFPAAQVKRVDVNLLSQDIALVPGQGDQVVVHLKGKEGIHLNARLAGETLYITRQDENAGKGSRWVGMGMVLFLEGRGGGGASGFLLPQANRTYHQRRFADAGHRGSGCTPGHHERGHYPTGGPGAPHAGGNAQEHLGGHQRGMQCGAHGVSKHEWARDFPRRLS